MYEIFSFLSDRETLQFSMDSSELNINEINQSDLEVQDSKQGMDTGDAAESQEKKQIFNVRKLELKFNQQEGSLFIFNDVTDSQLDINERI